MRSFTWPGIARLLFAYAATSLSIGVLGSGTARTDELAKLTAADEAAGAWFGHSLALSGSTAVVGARMTDCAGGAQCGSAYVYQFDGEYWIQVARLTASDAGDQEWFGHSVAIEGDTIVVGAPGDKAPGENKRGAAYVFVRPGGAWKDMTQSGKLTASDGVADDQLGTSVAIDGDTIVATAESDDCSGGGDACGAAYLFVRPLVGWITSTQTAKLTASDGVLGDSLGRSVAVSGNTVVVGAIGDDCGAGPSCGAVYVFVEPDGGWINASESAKLTTSDAGGSDQFGQAVSISDDTVAVGAWLADCAAGVQCGAAYVFVRPGGGWAGSQFQTAKLTNSDGAAEEHLGHSVSISGDAVVVGADQDNCLAGASCGAAYLFAKPAAGWIDATETAKFSASDAAPGDSLGVSVSIDGSTMIAGAYRADCGVGNDCGAAYLFHFPGVIYVDDFAPGLDNGTSWINAYTRLQDAIEAAMPGDEIWVAWGVYRPDQGGGETPGDRSATFQLKNSVALYGGFAGDETVLSQRDFSIYPSFLTGDLAPDDILIDCAQDSPDCDAFGGHCVDNYCIVADNNDENSYHVVTGSGTNNTAVLDGFIIVAGNANAPGNDSGGGMRNVLGGPTVTNCTFVGNYADRGGGMASSGNPELDSPRVTNCVFRSNHAGASGGGMWNLSDAASAVTGCLFEGNTAPFDGGAMWNHSTDGVSLTNCTFRRNSAADGGAIHNFLSDATIVNCLFHANSSQIGGAVFEDSSDSTLINCTMSGNTAAALGGGLHVTNSSPSLVNSIVWANSDGGGMDASAQINTASGAPTVSYSIIQGEWSGSGTNNSSSDPLFSDVHGPDNIAGTADDNFTVRPGSPAIDAGSNAALPSDVFDLDGDLDGNEPIPFDLGRNARQLDDPATPDTGGPGPLVVDIGAYEYFPDCNFNGVADAADLLNQTSQDANFDGTPDECARFTGACAPDDSWSCVDNWDLPGDVYPDDVASAQGIYAKVEEPHDVFLDVDAAIPGLRIERNAALRVTQSGAGNLTINTNAGLVSRGEIWTSHNRFIDIAGPFVLDPGGTYRPDVENSLCTDPVIAPYCGAADALRLSGSSWVPQGAPTKAAPRQNERFGTAVAVSGDFAVVGVPLEQGRGAAYVYERVSGAWFQRARLAAASSSSLVRQFGHAVSISGNLIAVAAEESCTGTCPKHVYIFERPAGGWADMSETARLDAPETFLSWGSAIDVGNDVVIVGANFSIGSPGPAVGEAYVYERPPGGWLTGAAADARLTAANAIGGYAFGWSVAIVDDGSVATVGDPYERGKGAVYMFQRPAGGWLDMTQTAKLTFSIPIQMDLGRTVALDGDVVVAATMQNNHEVLLFAKPNGNWEDMTETAVLSSSDFWEIGSSLSISGNIVVAGASRVFCSEGQWCGAAYVFEKPGAAWVDMTQSARLQAAAPKAHDRFGAAVAVSGSNLLVGSPGRKGQVAAVPNGVCTSLSTGSIVLNGDSFGEASGGSLALGDHMLAVTVGALHMHSQPTVGFPQSGLRSGISPPPKLDLADTSAIRIGGAFSVTGAPESTNASEFGVLLSGDWDNRSIAPSLFHWSGGHLILEGASPQTFEAAGIDLGATEEAYDTDVDALFDTNPHENFNIGTLEIMANCEVSFVNEYPNTVGAGACQEAHYVGTLLLGAGSTLHLNDCRLYYGTLFDFGATVEIQGCGELVQVPHAPDALTAESPVMPKVRHLSLVVPPIAQGTDTALRVELASLHHPTSPPAGTPDFTAFEGHFRYVNSVGGSTTCVDSATFGTNYRCGTLGCQPEYRDWATELASATNPASPAGLIHVTGDAVVPSSTLNVSHIGASCGVAPGANTCAVASTSLAVTTSRWGDVAGSGGGPPDGIQNVIDIGSVVDNVKGIPTAIPEHRAWMKNPPNTFGNPVNVIDIGLTVDSVKGFPYPYTIAACP